MAYDPNGRLGREVEKAETEVKSHKGIVAAVVVVVVLVAGYFFYAHHTNQPAFSKATVEQGYDSTKAAVTPSKSSSDAK